MSERRHWFWLVNGFLLLLFVWTLTEEATVGVRMADGVCTAVLDQRSSEIPCGELGYVGLTVIGRPDLQRYGPLDWLAPGTAWRDMLWQDNRGDVWQRLIFPATAGWRQVLGEWRSDEEGSVIRWPLPQDGDFAWG